MRLLFRPLVILIVLLPFLISILQDWRRWLIFGTPRKLSPEQQKRRAERLTLKIAALGPTFIKLAQLLGMREDFIPKIYADELKKLQDQVPPFPFKKVKKIVKEELGQPLEAVFPQFDPQPIAAASLGQVHCAQYKGERVAVKILRPKVEKIVAADLRMVFFLLIVVRYLFESHYLRSMWIALQEFSRMIRQEMDFKNEAINAEHFRQIFSYNPDIIIPQIYQELNTRRLFVLKYYEGIRVDNTKGLKQLGIDPMKLIQNLTEIYTRQTLIHGFLHADPHPGNILVNKEHQIIILDYGMTVTFDKDVKLDLLKLAYAAVRGDVESVVHGFYKLRLIDPEINPATMRDAARVLMEIQLGDDYNPRRIQQITDDILRTFYRFPLRLPSNLAYLFRASALVEGIGLAFDPYFNAVKTAKPIVLDMVKEVYIEPKRTLLERLIDRVADLVNFWESTRKVVYTAEREEMRMRVHPIDKIEIENFLATIMRRSLLGILAMGIAVVASIIFLKMGSPWLLVISYVVTFLIMILLILLPMKRGLPPSE